MPRRLTASLLALLAGAAAAVFAGSGCSTLTRLLRPHRVVRPDVVGVALPLSGKYEAVGKALLEGLRLGMKGSKVRLAVRDTQGEPDKAVEVLEDLAGAQQAIAVFGGVASAETVALARRADDLGVPLLSFSKEDGITASSSYAFRSMTSVRAQAHAMARFAACDLGLKSFAILGPDEPNAQALTAAFSGAAGEVGARVDAPVTYDAGQTTFTAEARRLSGRLELEKRADWVALRDQITREVEDPFRRRKALEKARASLPPILEAEALFLVDGWKTVSLIAPALAVEDVVTNACDTEDVKKIRATTGRDKLHTLILLGWSGWRSPETAAGTPELLERGGKFMRCAYYVDGFFAGSARPATRRFVGRFKEAPGGKTPNLLHAYAYDAAGMFRQVLEREPGPLDSERFRAVLAALEGYDGATGTTRFDAEREAIHHPFFIQIAGDGEREVPYFTDCRKTADTPRRRAPRG